MIPCEPGIPTAFDREFVRCDSYARHRPIRSRASQPGNKNQVRNSPKDAVGETCSLQNFGCANAAKECAPVQLPSSATVERGSRRIMLMTHATSEKPDQRSLTSVLSPQAGRGEGVRRHDPECRLFRQHSLSAFGSVTGALQVKFSQT